MTVTYKLDTTSKHFTVTNVVSVEVFVNNSKYGYEYKTLVITRKHRPTSELETVEILLDELEKISVLS